MNESAIGVPSSTELTNLDNIEKAVDKFLENENSSVVLVFPDGGYIELTKGCKFIGIIQEKAKNDILKSAP